MCLFVYSSIYSPCRQDLDACPSGPWGYRNGQTQFHAFERLKPRKTNKHIINAIAYVSRIINIELYSIIMYFEVPPLASLWA